MAMIMELEEEKVIGEPWYFPGDWNAYVLGGPSFWRSRLC